MNHTVMSNFPSHPDVSATESEMINLSNKESAVFTTSTIGTSASFMTYSTSVGGSLTALKDLNAHQLGVIGWCLWAVIVITLLGNLFTFYAVLDRRNFKKIMALDNPFLLSNVLCVVLSLVDLCQIVLVGIPAAISFCTASTDSKNKLGESFYNQAVVDPLLDWIVWTQLLLVTIICLDRACHICRPLHYNLKPWLMVLCVLICPAIPFFTLTLPYILAARAIMRNEEEKWMDRTKAFICSTFKFYIDGDHKYNNKIFMSCTIQLGSNWKHSDFYQTWENVGNPLILLLAVASLAGTSALIVYMLVQSAKLQKDNSTRQAEVARSIRKTCTVSIIQAVLVLVSSLPLRWYQISDRLHFHDEDYKDFDLHYKVAARLLVFLGPIFNPWLYSFRMDSVRTFLNSKRKRFFVSARRLQRSISSGVIRISRGTSTSTKITSTDLDPKSPDMARNSPIGARKSPLAARESPLAARKSPDTARISPLATRQSPVMARKSPHAAKKSPVAARKSSVAAQKNATDTDSAIAHNEYALSEIPTTATKPPADQVAFNDV